MKKKEVIHKHAECLPKGTVTYVQIAQYANGRPAIQLCSDTGAPEAMATCNLPDTKVPDGHVLIKDWSENKGIMEDLIDNGVIGPPVGVAPTGFCLAKLCPLRFEN